MGATLLCLALAALFIVGRDSAERVVLEMVIGLNALIICASVVVLGLYYRRERAHQRALLKRRNLERRGAPTLEQWMEANTPEAVAKGKDHS